ncbi:MAG: ATP-binding protein [Halanaeroarchaeum sp.]
MTFVLGRSADEGQTGSLGHFLATDGSRGAPVALDLDRPHVGLVVGKRGSGKSYTLGVLAEEIATTAGVAGVVMDPMAVFDGVAQLPDSRVVSEPTIRADALSPAGWCHLLDLDPATGPGALLWRASATTATLQDMRRVVDTAGAPAETRRAVLNHLELAASWKTFSPDGLTPESLLSGGVTVLDTSGIAAPAQAAIVSAVASGLYEGALDAESAPLPWLLVDEAHAVTETVAGRALRTLLTRGRHPGVSLVLATQRPAALPDVAISQADLVVSHRLTAGPDVEALADANPTYLDADLENRLPEGVGEAIVVDDATESAVTITVRKRKTPHGGDSPRATDRIAERRAPSGGPPPDEIAAPTESTTLGSGRR